MLKFVCVAAGTRSLPAPAPADGADKCYTSSTDLVNAIIDTPEKFSQYVMSVFTYLRRELVPKSFIYAVLVKVSLTGRSIKIDPWMLKCVIDDLNSMAKCGYRKYAIAETMSVVPMELMDTVDIDVKVKSKIGVYSGYLDEINQRGAADPLGLFPPAALLGADESYTSYNGSSIFDGFDDQPLIDSTLRLGHVCIDMPTEFSYYTQQNMYPQCPVSIAYKRSRAIENWALSEAAMTVVGQATGAALSSGFSGSSVAPWPKFIFSNTAVIDDQPPADSTLRSRHVCIDMPTEFSCHTQENMYPQCPVFIAYNISRTIDNWDLSEAAMTVVGQAAGAALSSGFSGSRDAPWPKLFSNIAVFGGFALTFASIGLHGIKPYLARVMTKTGAIATALAVIVSLGTGIPLALAWPFGTAASLLVAYSVAKS